MAASTTPSPGEDRRREMSPGEKLMAQWEAQHDVAARGHRGDPLGLQHSLSRERLAEQCRPPRSATGTEQGAGRQQAAAPEPPAEDPPPVRRHPWRRFHRHASEH